MLHDLAKVLKRGKYALTGSVIAVIVMAAGIASFANPTHSTAEAGCDAVNIIRCGVADGSTANQIKSFKSVYNKGSDSGHNDLKAVYAWAGASDSMVANMNTTNTKAGTLYRNGDIKVNGQTVATDSSIAARFTEGAGFTQISPGVWARKTTTSFAQPSEPVLVHFNKNGVADFAVAVNCGNAVKFTPKQPKTPPMNLACVGLTKELIGGDHSLTYKFTATASAKNTNITHYDFFFGDGKSNVQKVTTSSEQATATHEYANFNTDYNAHVVVYGKDFPNGKTGADCALTVHTQKKVKEVTPNIACESLHSTNSGLDYTFTATATTTNTTVSSFVFTISDGTVVRVPTTQNSATINHHFANHDTIYTVFVTVSDGNTTTPQTMQCSLQIKTPGLDECKPGIPTGSEECVTVPLQECEPGIPVGDIRCEETPAVLTANTLAKTGPADTIAIFIGAALAGAGLFRYVVSRKSFYREARELR